MSTLTFNSMVKQYKDKFEYMLNSITQQSIEASARANGVDMPTLQAAMEANNETFKRFCCGYASTLMPGKVGGATYAAVVARIALMFGKPYKTYAGFCLLRSNPQYAKYRAEYDAKKGTEEHPFFATHVYIEVGGVVYEVFNKEFEGIDHLDVVPIAEG